MSSKGWVMQLGRLGLAAALAAVLALPAAAQTTQTTPGKGSPAVTTTPGASKMSPAAGTPTTPPARTPAPASSSALVDINSATASELDALPGVGKARADAIIKNRPYKGKDDLTNRHIIPPNVYNGIKDKIIAKQG
jgi:competence protein ComEA